MTAVTFVFESGEVYRPAYVIDASVGVKWYLREDDSQRALRLLNEGIEERARLLAPSWMALEVANALCFNKRWSDADVREALDHLRVQPIEWVDVEPGMLAEIVELARQRGLTTYDALYVWLALRHRMPLVTADNAILRACRDVPYVMALDGVFPSIPLGDPEKEQPPPS